MFFTNKVNYFLYPSVRLSLRSQQKDAVFFILATSAYFDRIILYGIVSYLTLLL
jgi:hypothetical protein